jgi:hypothetical protein
MTDSSRLVRNKTAPNWLRPYAINDDLILFARTKFTGIQGSAYTYYRK